MTVKYATYKGRTYRLAFLGQTKFGRKAKLAFLDGSKEFWVPAEAVAESAAPAGRGRREPLCRCADPIDEGDGECMGCGYMMR